MDGGRVATAGFACSSIRIVEIFNKGFRMATVNFSVPDDVKQAFNEAFEGQNKSAVIADLMRQAVAQVEREARSRAAIDRILARQSRMPVLDEAKFRAARNKGRP